MIKKAANGTWMYDERHPITKRRKRVSGFRNRGEADTARSILLAKWRSEKHGTEAPEGSSAHLLLHTAVKFECDILDNTSNVEAHRKSGFHTRALTARRLLNYFPEDMRLSEMSVSHFREIADAEVSRGMSPKSVQTYLIDFKSILNMVKLRYLALLQDWELPTYNVPGYRSGKKSRRPWASEELSNLLEVLSQPERYIPPKHKKSTADQFRDLHDLIAIAALTGMRKTEILLIEVSKIYFEFGVMRVRTLKRKEGKVEFRDIPIEADLRGIIERRLSRGANQGDYLFPQRGAGTSTWVNRVMRLACQIAGLHYGQETRGIVLHGLRHTAATKMLNDGNDIATVAEILGNTVQTMLNEYAHTTIGSRKRAVASLSLPKGKTEEGDLRHAA